MLIKLQKDVYELDDVKLAYNAMSNECTALISVDDNFIQVNIVSQQHPDEVFKKFMYNLSEQETRSYLLKHNAKIRDLIVEHAFKPIENLEEII